MPDQQPDLTPPLPPPLRRQPAPPGHARSNEGRPPVQDIAVIGSGIAGLSAAWLLSQRHRVTLYEADRRPGGHSHTVEAAGADGRPVPVDTGFIVYNASTYPNLVALFDHLGVPTRPTEMSFGVSLDDGALEYAGTSLPALFAQRGNLVSRRFWSMLRDLLRFYREAPKDAARCGLMPLDDYLDSRGYGASFRHDHLYPMAAAIWSTPASGIGRYPVAAFVRFCENHHLLKLAQRPPWRTVVGGSREYVQRMLAQIAANSAGATAGGSGAAAGGSGAAAPGPASGAGLRLSCAATAVLRGEWQVQVATGDGQAPLRYDQVVIATHADQALRLLDAPDVRERRLLGAFAYTRNRAVLHRDTRLMPRRKAVWSSWNYLAERGTGGRLCVSYWMNRLQGLSGDTPYIVTLNPLQEPRAGSVFHEQDYEHPVFDAGALSAQADLWSLQGRSRVWFCGAYFGSGFHEDGLQSGLAVAEAIGGVRRPWTVADESGRIPLPASNQEGGRSARAQAHVAVPGALPAVREGAA